MEDSIYNRTIQELENQACEKLKSLNKQQISVLAQKEKKSIIIKYTILGLLFFFLFFVGVVFFIIMFVELRKSEEELALASIKKELKPKIIAKVQQDVQQRQLPSINFNITKTIIIRSESWSTQKMLLDENNKLFMFQAGKKCTKIYRYCDIINYEVYENGYSKVRGTAGKALIGGLFFGLGGLIVGSSTGKQVKEKCTQLQLIIRVNDPESPQIVVTYINGLFCDKNSFIYENVKKNIQFVCSQLEYMINQKTIEQQILNSNNETKNQLNAEALKNLKEMFEQGLITQEEFDVKRKQILGL